MSDDDYTINGDTPLRVHDISVKNNKYTYDDYIRSAFGDLYDAATSEQVASGAYDGVQTLKDTGLFRDVQVSLDVGPNEVDSRTTNVEVRVMEKGRLFGSVETTHDFARGENGVHVSGGVRNAFGRGERVDASAGVGVNGTSTWELGLTKKLGDLRQRLGNVVNVKVYKASTSHELSSSYRDINRGFSASLTPGDGVHSWGYELSWRDVVASSRSSLRDIFLRSYQATAQHQSEEFMEPSSDLLRECVPSVKSSVHYTFVRDRLDSTTAPTEGTRLYSRIELAGLGGDARFVKTEANWKKYWPINNRFSWGVGVNVGAVVPYHIDSSSLRPTLGTSAKSPSFLSDRLFVHHMLLRLFRHDSIGPRSESNTDSLGGQYLAAVGAECQYRLPTVALEELGVRARMFVNIATLSPWFNRTEMLSHARASCGVGLVAPTALGRLELNFGVPVVTRPGDLVDKWSISAGFNFV